MKKCQRERRSEKKVDLSTGIDSDQCKYRLFETAVMAGRGRGRGQSLRNDSQAVKR